MKEFKIFFRKVGENEGSKCLIETCLSSMGWKHVSRGDRHLSYGIRYPQAPVPMTTVPKEKYVNHPVLGKFKNIEIE